MNTETAIIFTVGSIVGSVLITQLWQMNYFKRENFKIQKNTVMAENRLKLKKLEKEMGLNTKQGSNTLISTETPGILELIKGLDKDKISDIIGLISKKDDVDLGEIDEPKSDIARIIEMLPPSVIEGFINNLNKKSEQSQPGEGY